MELDMFR